MKTLIFCSNSRFPFSALAGLIYLKKLPPVYREGELCDAFINLYSGEGFDKYASYMGTASDGTRVLSLSASSGILLIKNLTHTFLEMQGIKKSNYLALEILVPSAFLFYSGLILYKIFFTRRVGRHLVDIYMRRAYPLLAEAVKLDCNYQISDN